MRTLVTGATGVIAKALCAVLCNSGFSLRAAVRQNDSSLPFNCEIIEIGDISFKADWQKALSDVDAVIHLAGMAHRINNAAKNNFKDFHRVNVIGTEYLAKACAQAGVRRFIFISSIGVNGEFTDTKPFTEYDIPNPVGAYAVSKWEAEQALRKVAENTGMEVVILRPPLVYGPDAPGNFGRLIHLIQLGLPIPLGDIKNSRSFIYLGNLVDAIITCISHPLAAGETFLVSDGQDVSTPDLIKMIASAMNKKLVLFSLPPSILKGLCRIMGKAEELEKLTGTLLVDSSKIRNMLGWRPPFTLEEGIRETVKESRLPACRQASPATKSMA